MSTNKTQNYQLYGWAFNDEFPRSELNANFTKLDTALKAEATARAAAAQNEAAARAAAVATLNTAIGKKSEVVFGSYTGDGQFTRTISLGFTPKALLVEPNSGYQGQNCYTRGLVLQNSPLHYELLSIVTGGFQLKDAQTGSQFNSNGSIHYYIAFR